MTGLVDSTSLGLVKLVLLALLVSVEGTNPTDEGPRVKTTLGTLKGYFKQSQNGRQYEAYEGVPYAMPPVGKLRFKPPKRIPPWIGELQATKFGAPCLQYEQLPVDPNEPVIGSEDCLYLNVYVPSKGLNNGPRAPELPVLFYIHGGGFQFGTGIMMGPKYLMDRDVILVTINYRLGPLGFLSTQDEIVPGNMGLKDQNMALRWVSENIEWFGGDPKKITLVGLSAGGASVHYHYLSPLSAGLFRGGISLSGTSFDCWTQAKNPLQNAKKLGTLMGCPTTTTKEMVQCLRYRPARALVQSVKDYQIFYYNPFSPFAPVVEKISEGAFIDESPVKIINSGKVQDVPWVTGVTSDEGLWPIAEFMRNESSLTELNEKWSSIAPSYLYFEHTLSTEKHQQVSEAIKQHYMKNEKIGKSTIRQLAQLSGDRFFVVDSEKAARLQANVNKQPVYYYYFSYRGAHSLSEAMSGLTENYGVSHADDSYYVIDTKYMDPTTTKEDREMQRILLDFWVSFASNGVPKVNNVDWLNLDPNQKEFKFLHFESPKHIFMDSRTNLGEKEFWKSLGLQENILDSEPGTGKDEL